MDECPKVEGITLETVYEEILKIRAELKSFIDASETRTSLKIEDLKKRVNNLEVENDRLSNKIESIERETKKKNIVIFGLNIPEQDVSSEIVTQKLNKVLNTNLNPDNISYLHTLGKNGIKIELLSQKDKSLIFQKVKNLKGKNIFISQDLTKYQQEEKKVLVRFLKKEREDPNNKSYIRGNKLFVNGTPFSADELLAAEALPEEKPNSAPATPVSNRIEEIIAQENLGKEKEGKGPKLKDGKPLPSTGPSKNDSKGETTALLQTPKSKSKIETKTVVYRTRTRNGSYK